MDAGMGGASLRQTITTDAMKKAMDIQGRDILSLLQGVAASQQMQAPVQSQSTAQLTGIGQNIDIKG